MYNRISRFASFVSIETKQDFQLKDLSRVHDRLITREAYAVSFFFFLRSILFQVAALNEKLGAFVCFTELFQTRNLPVKLLVKKIGHFTIRISLIRSKHARR